VGFLYPEHAERPVEKGDHAALKSGPRLKEIEEWAERSAEVRVLIQYPREVE
jgi:hypothetical protein